MDVSPQPREKTKKGFTGHVQLAVKKGWRATIPKQLRKILDLQENSTIDIHIEDDKVVNVERLPTWDEIAGSIELDLGGKSLDEVMRKAKEEHYERRWQRKNNYG